MIRNVLKPFGLEIKTDSPESRIEDVDATELEESLIYHHLCVLRGFQQPSKKEMVSFCSRLGKIRQWKTGETIELKAGDPSENHVFTNRAVRLHWDGAFAFCTPRYIFFYCSVAPEPGKGGETIFCDAARVVAEATEEQRARWKNISITYAPPDTNGFASPLIVNHPVSGRPVIRYAEATEESVEITVHNIPETDTAAFFDEMRSVVYDPAGWYKHSWKIGDLVFVDNYALLHARNAFAPDTDRHLTKINIL